jgi:hypothetical protein
MVLADALRNVSLENFLEQRKAVDAIFRKRYQPIYYLSLLFSGIMVAISVYQTDFLSITFHAVAFVCLMADVTIALKKNNPINKLVNCYATGDENIDWQDARLRWLKFIEMRGLFISIGLLSLLIDAIW